MSTRTATPRGTPQSGRCMMRHSAVCARVTRYQIDAQDPQRRRFGDTISPLHPRHVSGHAGIDMRTAIKDPDRDASHRHTDSIQSAAGQQSQSSSTHCVPVRSGGRHDASRRRGSSQRCSRLFPARRNRRNRTALRPAVPHASAFRFAPSGWAESVNLTQMREEQPVKRGGILAFALRGGKGYNTVAMRPRLRGVTRLPHRTGTQPSRRRFDCWPAAVVSGSGSCRCKHHDLSLDGCAHANASITANVPRMQRRNRITRNSFAGICAHLSDTSWLTAQQPSVSSCIDPTEAFLEASARSSLDKVWLLRLQNIET